MTINLICYFKKKLARASSQMQAQFRPECFPKAEKTFWSHVSPPLSGGGGDSWFWPDCDA